MIQETKGIGVHVNVSITNGFGDWNPRRNRKGTRWEIPKVDDLLVVYFVLEFCRRYPFAENLLETTNSLFLDNLREEISSLSPELWKTCFSKAIQVIPEGSLFSLKFALKKLQRHILKKYERKDFIVRFSTAKQENPAIAHYLIDLKESSSAVLLNQIPQIYGLLINDDQWTTAMRMRCYLWPCNLPNELFCIFGASLTFPHFFNCNRFIFYRCTLHHAVRDQSVLI
ncbi:hypothetical protein P9112_000983 [Eukaryota sp. TZLM1-RC]